jgi:hypothetical protein
MRGNGEYWLMDKTVGLVEMLIIALPDIHGRRCWAKSEFIKHFVQDTTLGRPLTVMMFTT